MLRGGNGDDEIHGRNGDDLILGGPGDDRLSGDRGRDTLNGEDGNDQLFGNLDPDVVAGGDGNDRVQAGGAGPWTPEPSSWGTGTHGCGTRSISCAALVARRRLRDRGDRRARPRRRGRHAWAVRPVLLPRATCASCWRSRCRPGARRCG